MICEKCEKEVQFNCLRDLVYELAPEHPKEVPLHKKHSVHEAHCPCMSYAMGYGDARKDIRGLILDKMKELEKEELAENE